MGRCVLAHRQLLDPGCGDPNSEVYCEDLSASGDVVTGLYLEENAGLYLCD